MRKIILALFVLMLVACGNDTPTDTLTVSPTVAIVVPTETPQPVATAVPVPTEVVGNPFADTDFITVAMDVPDRSGLFANFDEFGNVIGIDPDLLAALTDKVGLEYELLVTRFDGMLAAVAAGEIGAAMSRIELSEPLPDGVVLTDPYFAVGQVMVVRANETEIATWRDISADMPIGVVAGSAGAAAAKDILQLSDLQTLSVADTAAALQLLSDFGVRAVIINNYDAENYAERYYQRLRLLATDSADYMISQQQYGIAVAADNPQLLARLNAGIAAMKKDGAEARVAQEWLVQATPIQAGDSLIGTPDDRLLIGVSGEIGSFDPASTAYTPLNWEIKQNIFSSLVGFDARNQLIPVLAESLPQVSAENTTYTFTLREGLTFADGTPLDASAVKVSLQRAAATANPLFSILKDGDVDGFADEDAIQVVDERQITFVLNQADSTFLSRMATPAYAIVNPRCDVANFDPSGNCSGIGPYRVASYEPDFALRLEANPLWPLT
ncbi:MAG TPA: transporter substrate-binding domain-containing protein, partial [Anaerolineae bacterium]|nr:transporter substrate-binding domain-containing protein [Anaerolineae bacterium]